jgi:hypothetical protein
MLLVLKPTTPYYIPLLAPSCSVYPVNLYEDENNQNYFGLWLCQILFFLVHFSATSPDISKTSDKSVESTKSHKLLWDHGADLGYDDSLSGIDFSSTSDST